MTAKKLHRTKSSRDLVNHESLVELPYVILLICYNCYYGVGVVFFGLVSFCIIHCRHFIILTSQAVFSFAAVLVTHAFCPFTFKTKGRTTTLKVTLNPATDTSI